MDTFTKSLRDGRTATVAAIEGGCFIRACIDGGEVYSGLLAVAPRQPGIPPEMTRRAGPILLTESEYDEIRALQSAARQARLDAPEGQAASLKYQRETLVRAAGNAAAAWTAARGAAQDNDTMGTYFSGQDAQDRAAITEAGQALADFDAAHPEIAAELRSRHDADVARWAAL